MAQGVKAERRDAELLAEFGHEAAPLRERLAHGGAVLHRHEEGRSVAAHAQAADGDILEGAAARTLRTAGQGLARHRELASRFVKAAGGYARRVRPLDAKLKSLRALDQPWPVEQSVRQTALRPAIPGDAA